MDGQGPIRGRTRPLGWLISGTNPIACELICCKLVNIKPKDLPIIKTARQLGLGCSDIEEIKILGDDFSQRICADFKLPRLIAVRFSFLFRGGLWEMSKYRLNNLLKTIERLPLPRYKGEILQTRLLEEVWEREYVNRDKNGTEAEPIYSMTLEAEVYTNEIDEWLEWVIRDICLPKD